MRCDWGPGGCAGADTGACYPYPVWSGSPLDDESYYNVELVRGSFGSLLRPPTYAFSVRCLFLALSYGLSSHSVEVGRGFCSSTLSPLLVVYSRGFRVFHAGLLYYMRVFKYGIGYMPFRNKLSRCVFGFAQVFC